LDLDVTQEFIMATLTGVGISHQRNVAKAAQEAVNKAFLAAGTQEPDFVLLFASLGYNPEKLLQSVRQATGNCPLVGCSGQGIIVQGEADESSFSVAVMVIKSDELHFTTHLAHPQGNGSETLSFEQVGEALGHKIQRDMPADPIALFLFTDGLTLNFDRLAIGLQSTLQIQNFLPILGGAAGSNVEMQLTYQFCDDRVLTDGTVAALMSGTAQIAWASNHGCVPITRATDNMIYELDHKPVFDVLQQYFSPEEIDRWDRTMVSFCFGLKLQDEDEFTIRYLPRKDEAAGAVMLQTEVTEGSSIWVMRRDQDLIFQGTETLAQSINGQLNGKSPKFIFQVDCYGRGKSILTEQQKQENLNQLQKTIGPDLPWIGFYSHGEIAPIGQKNLFHNYTLVLVAIY
jgi:hypothetical protein